MPRKFLPLMLAAVCGVILTPRALAAQSLWMERSHSRSFAFEVLKPDFKGAEAGSFTTDRSGWIAFATLRLPISEKNLLVGELPFVYGSWKTTSDFFNDSGSQSFLGNPYFGVEIKDRSGAFTTEVGLRIPVTPDDEFLGVLTGVYSEYDRFEAFVPDIIPVMTIANYRYRAPSGFALKLRSGPTLFVYTDDSDNDVDLFFGYSAQAGYESEQFSILGGVSGRALLTEENLDFDERSIHQLGFNAGAGLGKARPGVHFRLPLDDELKEALDFVLGLNLSVQF